MMSFLQYGPIFKDRLVNVNLQMYKLRITQIFVCLSIIIKSTNLKCKQTMGKKQVKNVPTEQHFEQIQVEEQGKTETVADSSKISSKYLPHDKYTIRRTKLINKRKNEAIEFIKLDKHQVLKAVTCLKQFDKSHQNIKNLFSEDGFIYLEIDASKVPENYSIRPVQVSLPHPIYKQESSRFTIFSCDPEKEFTDKIQNMEIPQIAEVIGYEKAKKNYRQNKDKLKLLAANDLFFCDWKIYNLLRQPLGKVFYEKKKFPFPIDCQEVPESLQSKFSTYEEYINDLGNHTYFMMGNGPVYTIKIGRVSMQESQLVKNVMRGVFRALPYILGSELQSSDIRQISLKTFNSPSLPIYNFLKTEEVEGFSKVEKPVKEITVAKKEKSSKKK